MAFLFAVFPATNALAGNFLYQTGYGSESSFMGGADIAVARDSFSVNNNPAGLSQIPGQSLQINATPFDAEGASHSDDYGSYRRHIKNEFGMVGNAGYARHIGNSPYTFGVIIVVQGGLGWTYKNMTTAFGTRDEATSMASVIKLAPGLSWKVNDRLSLGANLGLNYSASSQTLFPNTSDNTNPSQPFFGINFKDASGYGLNAKFGLQYRPLENVVVGVTYGTRTKIPLKGGTLRVNYSSIGQGIVRYDDAQVKGFGLPEEVGVGLSFRPLKSLLISLQNKWYDWSETSQALTLIAKSPRNAAVPQQITQTTQIGALDQHVYSFGAAYDYSEKTILFVGANYGRRNVPEQNLAPTFQVIQQMHYMAGLSHAFDREWTGYVGIERLPQQMVTYNNPLLPFGTSVANHSGTELHLQASRNW